MVQVDPADHHERGEKEGGGDEIENGHGAPARQGEENARQELDRRIAPRDGIVAGAAAAAEREPGDDRNIVEPADRGAAIRAGRRRMDDAPFQG